MIKSFIPSSARSFEDLMNRTRIKVESVHPNSVGVGVGIGDYSPWCLFSPFMHVLDCLRQVCAR